MKRFFRVDDDDELAQTASYHEAGIEQLGKPNVTWQHRWPSSETQDALAQSQFVAIPNEIMLRLFGLLSVGDLCRVSSVCRLFKMITDQDEIWKFKCNTTTKLYSKSFKQIYMEWMHEKCVRNVQLRSMRQWHRTACIMCSPPSYPIRPTSEHRFEPIGGFLQHPNSSSDMTIKLSVDIDNTARELNKLLEKASKFQEQWEQPPILKQMIRRYYRFMQLKASLPSNILLIPTLDIEIIWQTHLLRPEMYRADCLRLFRRVIDHSLLITDVQEFFKEQAFSDTCQLYEQRFGEQYCSSLPSVQGEKDTASNDFLRWPRNDTQMKFGYSYWDKADFKFSSEAPKDSENPFSFTEAEVTLDGRWLDMCKNFMSAASKKVSVRNRYDAQSREIDLSTGAMKRLKKSYERFLYMAAKHPVTDGNGFVPPTYAIDIMWHSHMQEPVKYIEDCQRLVGYVVLHAPWPVMEDQTMKKAHRKTDQMWKDEFASEIETDHLYNTIDEHLDWD